MKLILYHGTSKENAERIQKEGFIPDKKYNWAIKSKTGFVYLSLAYAPFYAMHSVKKEQENDLALIKCEVDSKDCYPEDDFIMYSLGKPVYTQEELNKVNIEKFKRLANLSLRYMGNVAVKPHNIKILGVKNFNGRLLLLKCDPVIAPINFMIMGGYYRGMTEELFSGVPVEKLKGFMEAEIKCQK